MPTEDEWEYLCGGGSRAFYPWGDCLDIGYLSIGTYFRDCYIFDEEMAYKDEITGDYTFTRRIKRLS
ncbi:hypothetical protein [Chitinophaga sp. 212800010-3]|uniref:hypothetical protein n=1 Tax=unclassified Chitinophaga TaxID=2619133 RepID=UPI003FA44E47